MVIVPVLLPAATQAPGVAVTLRGGLTPVGQSEDALSSSISDDEEPPPEELRASS